MKVSAKNSDALNLELTIEIAPEDYAAAEKKQLSACRRKAEFKGFRKGMVPASLISKIYGEQCLAEAVNEVVSAQLQKHIDDNKLRVLGEPLSSASQPELEWKSGNAFTFIFDIALTPEVNVEVEKKDSIERYDISVAASEKKDMVANMKKYYESLKENADKKGEKPAVEKTDEEIEKEVSERMEEQYRQESEWRLTSDIKKYFVQKSGVELPEAFLKRWLKQANKDKVTDEQFEKEFPGFLEDFKWQLVRGSLMKKFDVKIESKDLEEAAEAFVSYQYAMYGLSNVPAETIKEAAKNLLSDRSQIERLVEQVEDKKVLEKIRETVTVKDKKITSAKFRELK